MHESLFDHYSLKCLCNIQFYMWNVSQCKKKIYKYRNPYGPYPKGSVTGPVQLEPHISLLHTFELNF